MGRAIHFVACAALVAGCGRSGDGASARTVESSRVVSQAGVDFQGGGSTAERFGIGPSRGTPKSAEAPVEAAPAFAWTTPEGWTELAPTAMRTANFRPAGDPHAECYLTLLAGDAGGLGANANRWRAQLGLPPLSPGEIDALPRSSFFGGDAVLVEAGGTWKGMSGSEASPGWGIAGLLLVQPGGSAFLKMTGPASLVTAQRDAFLALARSFRTQETAVHPDAAGRGHDHDVDHEADRDEGPRADVGEASGFIFQIPSGWRKAPDRPMRAVTLFAGSDDALECYVTAFPGDAGGILANVNRWRGQLGEPAIAESAIAGMEKIPMLGREAVLVECAGKGSQLVGAACPGADRSVFVKMSGPPELVQAQRAAFLEFCATLRNGN